MLEKKRELEVLLINIDNIKTMVMVKKEQLLLMEMKTKAILKI